MINPFRPLGLFFKYNYILFQVVINIFIYLTQPFGDLSLDIGISKPRLIHDSPL